MGIRKNVTALTAAERADYVTAVKALKAQPSGRNYDWFVNTHIDYFGAVDGVRYAHGSPSFLPWHRIYLYEFELALRVYKPNLTLPYWDWTSERSMTGLPWTNDFMGGNGDPVNRIVTTGPFAGAAQWRVYRSSSEGYDLRRAMAVSPRGALPTTTMVNEMLAHSVYDVAPWDRTAADGMRNTMEGFRAPNIHNGVHVWIGGNMAMADSPNDPVFFLHHCNIDRLWSQWQTRWGFDDGHYQPAGRTAGVVSLTEPVRPFGDITAQQILDHRPMYTYAG